MTTNIETIVQGFSTDDHNTVGEAMMAAINEKAILTKDYCGHNPEDRDTVTEEEFTTIIERTIPALKAFAEGSRLEDEIGHIVYGLCNGVHYRRRNLRTKAEKLDAELSLAHRDFDGTEIANNRLEEITSSLKDMDITITMMTTLRQVLISALHTHFDMRWVPPGGGSYTQRARKRTSAFIEAADYLNARRKAATDELTPAGTFIAFAGARDFGDEQSIWKTLDKLREEYPDMILVHTGCASGGDLIADKWALAKAVHRIAVKPKFDEHGTRRAPFERNRLLLKEFPPEVLVATPGPGYIENLIEEVDKRKRRVIRIGLMPRNTTAS